MDVFKGIATYMAFNPDGELFVFKKRAERDEFLTRFPRAQVVDTVVMAREWIAEETQVGWKRRMIEPPPTNTGRLE